MKPSLGRGVAVGLNVRSWSGRPYGLKEIDQGWDMGCGEFYERMLEEVPESIEVRA